jgi:hypothetical protein
MTTLNLQVNTSAGDAHAGSINNDSGRNVTTGANISSLTDNPISPGSQGGNNEHTAAFRFTNVTVPQGSTINSATFKLTAQATYNAGASTISYLVSAEASDNAPAMVATGSGENLRSSTGTAPRPRTTAVSAAWNQNSVVANTEYSIDITSVIQEIVNRAGWASGNAILVIVDTNTTTTLGEWQDYYSYDGDPAKAAKLDIDYGSSGQPTTKRFGGVPHVPTVNMYQGGKVW